MAGRFFLCLKIYLKLVFWVAETLLPCYELAVIKYVLDFSGDVDRNF